MNDENERFIPYFHTNIHTDGRKITDCDIFFNLINGLFKLYIELCSRKGKR